MENIPWGILAPILVIEAILFIVALVDLIRVEKTNGPKFLWAILIIFVGIIGPVLYFVVGRRSS